MVVAWTFPTRILFGEGATIEIGTEAKRLNGTRALIVTDPGIVAAGLIQPIITALEKSGITHVVFDRIASNPNESHVEDAARAYRDSGADFVVAVGGGSAIDVGKLVRLRATHSLPLAEYDETLHGGEKVTGKVPPMIAVPTTSGTGSEVGRGSVVQLGATKKKTTIAAPKLLPDVAVLDPRMTLSLPPATTAATGFEALAHSIEAYCALGDHPMADAIALEGIELIGHHLERAVNDGSDIEARGAMLKAAMMGGVAMRKGLGVCHSLAHPLDSELNLHYGLANALCLPAVLDFNRAAIPMKIAHIARILGARGNDVETLAFECSGAVRSLRKKCHLPQSLAEVGVTEALITKLAASAMRDSYHHLNPRPCTQGDMVALYQSSM
ncbi:MAG: iron-containing alcohol dehydrogenase [Sandaracinaceae bacterium]|nr:iron-containing alcohol dehydrogenase [Sandaracinaceae bacterium]